MDNETNKKSIREKVLEIIKSGKIAMRPKWHFIFRAALFISGTAIVLLALLYLVSFIIFSLRQTGLWFIPVFGSRGWFEFFTSFPWLLIVFAVIFILLLETLVRRYSLAFRRPLIYSILGIILIVIIGGAIINQTPLHRNLLRYTEENRLPFAGGLYRTFGFQQSRNTVVGNIIEINKDGFIIQGRRNKNTSIVVNRQTRFPFGTDFAEGDTVVIFGKRNGDIIQAFGIEKIGSEFGPPIRMPSSRRPFNSLPLR